MKKNLLLLLILLMGTVFNYIPRPKEVKAVYATLEVTDVVNYYPAYTGSNSASNPAYAEITIYGEMSYWDWYGLTGNTLGCYQTPQRDRTEIYLDDTTICGEPTLGPGNTPWWNVGSMIYDIDYANQIVRWHFGLSLYGLSVGQHRFRLFGDVYNYNNQQTYTLASAWINFYVMDPPSPPPPPPPPPPPAPATINITPDRYMSWNIEGNPYLCSGSYGGNCVSGSTQTYSFDATNYPNHTVSAYAASANVVGYSLSPLKKLASKFFNFVTASSGSGATCNSSPGGSCNLNLTTTYCSTYINGLWNAGNNTADNFSFQINGPGGTYTIDHTGYYSLVADSSATTYNVISYPSTTSTQRGYTSDLIRYPYSFSCSSAGGGYMEFEYKSKPILDVR